MPIYEYQCKQCFHSFEKLIFKNDNETIDCPECGANNVKKLLSSNSFVKKSLNGGSSCSGGHLNQFS